MDEQITHNHFTEASASSTSACATGCAPMLSICIPTWRDSSSPLLAALGALIDQKNCEILVYDDGSADPAITAAITQSLSRIKAPARLITARENHGRAHARNRLIAHAASAWLLLLDADMLPDDAKFLTRYLDAIKLDPSPGLVAGGFSLRQVTATRKQRLHAAQSRASECVPAAQRAIEPGLYVFTSNILVHRTVLDRVQFDEGYTGWGWEDVDWGLRVAKAFPVRHIENTATHLGLDDTANLMRKYAGSSSNFARLASQHPEEVAKMKLYQVSKKLKAFPARPVLRGITKTLARDPLGLVPIKLRLFCLKLFRAATYAEALK